MLSSDTVQKVYQAAEQERETDEAARLHYAIRGAMRMRDAKEDKKLALRREIEVLDREIESLNKALDDAQDGYEVSINKLMANSGGDEKCCIQPMAGDRPYNRIEAPAVSVNVNR